MEYPSTTDPTTDGSLLKITPAAILCTLHQAHLHQTPIPDNFFCHQIVHYRQKPHILHSITYEPSTHSLTIEFSLPTTSLWCPLRGKPPTRHNYIPLLHSITSASSSYHYEFFLTSELFQHSLFELKNPLPLALPPLSSHTPTKPPQVSSTGTSHFNLSCASTLQILQFYLPFIPPAFIETLQASLHLTAQPIWPNTTAPLHTTFPFILTVAIAPHQPYTTSFASETLQIPLTRTPTHTLPAQIPQDMLVFITQVLLFDQLWPLLEHHWQLSTNSRSFPTPTPLPYTPLLLLTLPPEKTLLLTPLSIPHLSPSACFNLSDNLDLLYPSPSPPHQPHPTPFAPPNIHHFLQCLQNALLAAMSC